MPPGRAKLRHQAGGYRIAPYDDDRDCGSGLGRCSGSRYRHGKNERRFLRRNLISQGLQTGIRSACPALLDHELRAFFPAQRREPFPERHKAMPERLTWKPAQPADHDRLLLLRERRPRRERCGAEHDEQIATGFHLITPLPRIGPV